MESAFQSVLTMFCASHEFRPAEEGGMPLSKASTMRTHWMKLEKGRRTKVKKNLSASGIEEEFGEFESAIDRLIAEIDDKKAADAEKKMDESRRQKSLCEAGQEIRDLALKRALSSDGSYSSKEGKKKRKTIAVVDLTCDTELQILQEDANHRREAEKKRLQLDERRVALEENRFKREKEERKMHMDLMRLSSRNLTKPINNTFYHF